MLNFEYQYNSGGYRAEYRGLIVKAIQDSDCDNPWEDSVGLAPLLVYADGWQDYTAGADIESPLAALSAGRIARQWAAEYDCIPSFSEPGSHIPDGCGEYQAEIRRTKESSGSCWTSEPFYLQGVE